MNVGFIGTGSMGTILIEALIKSMALHPTQIFASNRTIEKALKLADQFPGLHVQRANSDTVLASDILFLCIKPLEYKKVFEEIRSSVKESTIIISITSPVLLEHLEAELPSKIVKVIPSITNSELSGATLCIYGRRMEQADREKVEHLLKYISTPLETSEDYTRICSDLASCGPAFFAHLLQSFIQAAVDKTGLPKETATTLACEMLLGTGKLLTSGGFTPEALEKRVTVPNGITEEAIHIIEQTTRQMFHRVIHKTHEKYESDIDKVEYSLKNADQRSLR